MCTRLRSREEMGVTGIIVGYFLDVKTRTFPICKEVVFMCLYIQHLLKDYLILFTLDS